MRRLFSGAIAQGSIRSALILFLRLLAQALTLVLLARVLGAAGFGEFMALAALSIIFGSLSSLGTHLILLGDVSKDPGSRHEILSFAVPTTLLVGGGLFLIYNVSAYWAFRGVDVDWNAVAALGFAEIIVQPLVNIASMELLAYGQIARSQLMNILPLLLRLLALIGVFVLSLEVSLTFFSVAYLMACVIGLIFALHILPESWPRVKAWRILTPLEFHRSIGYAVLNLTYLGPNEIDKVVAIKLVPAEVAGLYGVGNRIIGAVTLPIVALLTAAMPQMFRESDGAFPRNHSRLNLLILLIALIYGGFASVALYLALPFFEWLFGAGYSNLGAVMPWLAVAIPGLALRMAVGAILVTQSRPWVVAAIELFGMGCLLFAALVFTRDFMYSGMSMALALAEWCMALVGVRMILFPLRMRGGS